MRRAVSAIAIAIFLTAGPIRAFEAAGADIIGLRLGMSESEVVDGLAQQGYAVDSSGEAISATTKDGRLQVALSPGRVVTAISYAFFWRGAGAPTKIHDSILVRFGNPDQVNPPTWCRAVGHDGICPGNQASLTFLQDSLTLRLSAGQDESR
jgi:hypothetical protein